MRTTKPIRCMVCASSKNTVYKEFKQFKYLKCSKCTAIFVDPIRPQKFYLETKTYLHDMDAYVGFINPYGHRWIAEQFERLSETAFGDKGKRPVLEIGAGVGFLELTLLARGWEVSGIETSEQAVEFGKKYYKVDLEHTTVEEFKSKKKFGAFMMVEVLEHFINPLVAIEAIKPLSDRRGMIFGTTPNTDSLYWDSPEQNIYVPEDHIVLFNKKSLRHFCKVAGIKKLQVEYFGSGPKNDSNLMFSGVISN